MVDCEASMPMEVPDDYQRKCNEPLPVIIDLSKVTDIDYTAALVNYFSKKNSQFS